LIYHHRLPFVQQVTYDRESERQPWRLCVV
jgi:hypothetical protein